MSSKLDFSNELIGRRALVTGGTRGIGYDIAAALLGEGASVFICGRSESALRDALTALEASAPGRAGGVHVGRTVEKHHACIHRKPPFPSTFAGGCLLVPGC